MSSKTVNLPAIGTTKSGGRQSLIASFYSLTKMPVPFELQQLPAIPREVFRPLQLSPRGRPSLSAIQEFLAPSPSANVFTCLGRESAGHTGCQDAISRPPPCRIRGRQRIQVWVMGAENQDAICRNIFPLERFRNGQQRRSAAAGSFIADHEHGLVRQSSANLLPLEFVERAMAVIGMTSRADGSPLDVDSELSKLSCNDRAKSGSDATESQDQSARAAHVSLCDQIRIIKWVECVIGKTLRGGYADARVVVDARENSERLGSQSRGIERILCVAAER